VLVEHTGRNNFPTQDPKSGATSALRAPINSESFRRVDVGTRSVSKRHSQFGANGHLYGRFERGKQHGMKTR